MKIYDVSIPISKDMVVYPGDPPVKIERKAAIGKKESKYNASRLSLGSHTGTHVDPPFHFVAGGLTVDRLPVELLIGRARVVEITAPRIDEAALSEFDFADAVRVLFKTRNSYFWSEPHLVEDYCYITAGAAEKLVDEGIKVVGMDYVSVDKFGSTEFETHQVLLGAGTIIIEGLDLREIEAANYEMICLPLKVKDGDGAPARVLLRRA